MSQASKAELIASQNEILLKEFNLRQAKNARFSLRAYAKQLGISPTLLSLVLSGKSALGVDAANQVATILSLEGKRRQQFVPSRNEKKRWRPKRAPRTVRISDETLRKVGDWKSLAVLAAVGVPSFEGQARRIASGLGLKASETEKILRTLARTGLIMRVDEGYEIRSSRFRSTAGEVTREVSKRLAKDILQKVRRQIDGPTLADFPAISATFGCRKQDISALRSQLKSAVQRVVRRYSDNAVGHDTVLQLVIGYSDLVKGSDTRG